MNAESITHVIEHCKALGYPRLAEQAAAELARLRAIEAAALEFVNEDGRGDPPAKYQALKDALKGES